MDLKLGVLTEFTTVSSGTKISRTITLRLFLLSAWIFKMLRAQERLWKNTLFLYDSVQKSDYTNSAYLLWINDLSIVGPIQVKTAF